MGALLQNHECAFDIATSVEFFVPDAKYATRFVECSRWSSVQLLKLPLDHKTRVPYYLSMQGDNFIIICFFFFYPSHCFRVMGVMSTMLLQHCLSGKSTKHLYALLLLAQTRIQLFFFSLCWWLYRSDCGVAVDLNVLRVEILRSLHRKCVCWLVSMSVSVQVPFTMSKMPHLHETGVCELAHVDCGRIQNSASRIFHSVWRTRQKNTSPL